MARRASGKHQCGHLDTASSHFHHDTTFVDNFMVYCFVFVFAGPVRFGSMQALAEKAFEGVLRMNASACITDTHKLIGDFVSRFLFSQPVLTEAFVPVALRAMISAPRSSTMTQDQSRNMSVQNTAIREQVCVVSFLCPSCVLCWEAAWVQ